MLSEMCRLRGQRGLKLVASFGPWAVVCNRAREQRGAASRWAVIQHQEGFVDGAHANEDAALDAAWDAYTMQGAE